MTLRDRPYPAFFGFAALLFLAATLGSDIVARTTVGGEDLGKAITEHAYYAVVQPIGTAMLLAPFLLLGWMSASLAKRKGFEEGLGVFLIGTLLLGFMYFSGYQDSQSYMEQRMWTAATLAVGLLPFKSVPPLLICLGFRWLIARKKDEAKT
jgi:hypothetical protein